MQPACAQVVCCSLLCQGWALHKGVGLLRGDMVGHAYATIRKRIAVSECTGSHPNVCRHVPPPQSRWWMRKCLHTNTLLCVCARVHECAKKRVWTYMCSDAYACVQLSKNVMDAKLLPRKHFLSVHARTQIHEAEARAFACACFQTHMHVCVCTHVLVCPHI